MTARIIARTSALALALLFLACGGPHTGTNDGGDGGTNCTTDCTPPDGGDGGVVSAGFSVHIKAYAPADAIPDTYSLRMWTSTTEGPRDHDQDQNGQPPFSPLDLSNNVYELGTCSSGSVCDFTIDDHTGEGIEQGYASRTLPHTHYLWVIPMSSKHLFSYKEIQIMRSGTYEFRWDTLGDYGRILNGMYSCTNADGAVSLKTLEYASYYQGTFSHPVILHPQPVQGVTGYLLGSHFSGSFDGVTELGGTISEDSRTVTFWNEQNGQPVDGTQGTCTLNQ